MVVIAPPLLWPGKSYVTGGITYLGCSFVTNVHLPTGSIIDDRYEIIAHLGDGGMGSVHKVQDRETERVMALKLLDPELSRDVEWRARFVREGKALSQMSHPHILTVYRLAFWNNLPFITMEYLEGRDLRSEVQKGSLDWQRSVRIVMQICEGMFYAHQKRVIHRDLKPANIMLLDEPCEDFVKILDFGLARIASSATTQSQSLTQTGSLIGSVHYMSPEQCIGRKADHRADIYAVGCLLYECISGDPPFSADNPIGLMHKHVSEPVTLLRTLPHLETLPKQVDAVIQKSMAKDINARYQSMDEMRQDLHFLCTGEFRRMVANETQRKRPDGKRSLKMVGASAAVICLTLGAVALLNTDDGIAVTFWFRHSQDHYSDLVDAVLQRTDELISQQRNSAAIKLLNSVIQQSNKAAPSRFQLARLYERIAQVYAKIDDKARARRFIEAALISYDQYLLSTHKDIAPILPNDLPLLSSMIKLVQTLGLNYLFEYAEFVRLHPNQYTAAGQKPPEVKKNDNLEDSLEHIFRCLHRTGTKEAQKIQFELKMLQPPLVRKLNDPVFAAQFYFNVGALAPPASSDRRVFLKDAATEFNAIGDPVRAAESFEKLRADSKPNTFARREAMKLERELFSDLQLAQPDKYKDKNIIDLSCRLAKEYAADNQFDTVLELYNRVFRGVAPLDLHIGDLVVYTTALARTGRYSDAVSTIQQRICLLEAGNNFADAIVLENCAGNFSLQLNKYAEALKFFQSALSHVSLVDCKHTALYACDAVFEIGAMLGCYRDLRDWTKFDSEMTTARELLKKNPFANGQDCLDWLQISKDILAGNYQSADSLLNQRISEYKDADGSQQRDRLAQRLANFEIRLILNYEAVGEIERANEIFTQLPPNVIEGTAEQWCLAYILCGREDKAKGLLSKIPAGEHAFKTVGMFDPLQGIIALLKGQQTVCERYFHVASEDIRALALPADSPQAQAFLVLKQARDASQGLHRDNSMANLNHAPDLAGIGPYLPRTTFWQYNLLSSVATANGQSALARRYKEEAYEAMKSFLGSKHPAVIKAERNLKGATN